MSMNASQYEKEVLITESRKFYNDSVIPGMVLSLFEWLHNNTLAGRFIKIRNIRLNHAAMGMVTEIAELFEMMEKTEGKSLDLVNLREEVGDILWYCAIATHELRIPLQDLLDKNKQKSSKFSPDQSFGETKQKFEKSLNKLVIHSGRFLDLMKKGVFYGREIPSEKMVTEIEEILHYCQELLILGNFSMESAFSVNIQKLQKKRFKTGKFTEKEALVRNLEEERKVLEQK